MWHAADVMKTSTCTQRQMRMAAALHVRCWVWALLLVLPLASAVVNRHEQDEAFIGWNGESYRPNDPRALSGQAGRDPSKRAWVEVLSWKPRAFLYHNFLTEAEAVHLKRLAAPTMKRSTVVRNASVIIAESRTSYSTFITRKVDAVEERIEARVANWVMVPPVHLEDMEVLHYSPGQYFAPHFDNLHSDKGPRVATVLMYLNDVEEGGETAFIDDRAEWLHQEAGAKHDEGFSECAKGHVALKPKLGDALLFWTITGEDWNQVDPHSKHVGCPVVRGVKWTATKLVYVRPYKPEEYYGAPEDRTLGPDPGHCVDTDPNCPSRAAAGDCIKDKEYMVGDDVGEADGRCRLSCQVCQACAKGDKECYNNNRRNAGYLVFDWEELANASVYRPSTQGIR